MITEYHRPQTLEEAVKLLSRTAPKTYPLGGGTVLNQPGRQGVAVVDLQLLGLNGIGLQGNRLVIGAAATLQQVLEYTSTPPALKDAIRQEANLHLRQVGTAAGSLVSAGSRSTFAAACLALDARLVWAPDGVEIGLGDWLAVRTSQPGVLITAITLPANCRLAYEAVSRTPGDWPLVCAAAARWPSGRTRLVLGGWGDGLVVVMDGAGSGGAEQAARDAYSRAGDAWASAEYRQEIAGVLARRCIQKLEAE